MGCISTKSVKNLLAELPPGWRWTKLEEVIEDFQSGFPCSKKHEVEDGIPHLRPNNIGFDGKLDLSKLVHIPKEMVDFKRYSLKKGDVLFNNTNSKELVGRASMVEENLNYGFSNHITRLRVNKRWLIPEWLVISINYFWLRGYFLKICKKWIGQAGVNIAMLRDISIPLPPLDEQRRIVARIEELLSRVEEARRLRRAAREEAERIMQAALHKVFSRAEEEGWEWIKLGDALVKKPQYGLTSKSSKKEKEVRYIRISDITDYGELKDDDPRFLDLSPDEFEKYKLEKNDILIARSGTVGRVYLHRSLKTKAVFASYLIRFKLDSTRIIPKFFFYYGLSPFYKKWIEFTLRKVAQPNINAREYSKLKIPLPPLDEQEKIIAYFDKIRETEESLRKLQQGTEKELEKLAPAILDRAFKGSL
jgi:type I restriction enzyme S subunit